MGKRRNSNRCRALTERLSEAQNHRCAYCGTDIRVGATLDHLQTVSQGGKTTYENCVAACWWCNNRRGDKNPQAFFKLVLSNIFRPIFGRSKTGQSP